MQHNGMSLFPATVPEGTLLYHGGFRSTTPDGPEWLSFEIQHAEMFAQGNVMLKRDPEDPDAEFEDMLWRRGLSEAGSDLDKFPVDGHITGYNPGFIHIFKTNRPLRLLYIDGMGAAKCDKGSMDTQDKLLLLNTTLGWFDEMSRATALCKLAEEWGLDGFMRMETGFEIIKCNFSTGLEVLHVNQRPNGGTPAAVGQFTLFEYIREASKRYLGNSDGRIVLDYSNMVSAYFYPVNLSNPNATLPDPTLSFVDIEQLEHMRSDVSTSLKTSFQPASINWQDVVDMIVTRYSDRLQYMATGLPHPLFLSLINNLLNILIDFKDVACTESLIDTCATYYLRSVKPSTERDHMIFAALHAVTHKICKTFFDVREILFQIEKEELPKNTGTSSALDMIWSLNDWLDWTDWKHCGNCGYDKVCFIAMFPYGTEEDHLHPRCKGADELNRRAPRATNYWRSKLRDS